MITYAKSPYTRYKNNKLKSIVVPISKCPSKKSISSNRFEKIDLPAPQIEAAQE